jgi:hypothetical protein
MNHTDRPARTVRVPRHSRLIPVMKYFELAPFDFHLRVDTVLAALREDEAATRDQPETGKEHDVGGSAP